MNKQKFSLNKLKVNSFIIDQKEQLNAVGGSNNRVCATYTSPEMCDSRHPAFCETGFRCP